MIIHTLPSLLIGMAEIVDAPEGPGGGAILLAAACELERLASGAEPDQIEDVGLLEGRIWADDRARGVA